MNITALHKLAGREEVDYTFLMSALARYKSPRDKVTAWLTSGELIRIKKGLYIFGRQVAQSPYSVEVLANLIYGPSALSLNYALSFYGLIPERVSTVTSITTKRKKYFSTPIGDYTYTYLHAKKYAIGIEWIQRGKNTAFLIASPEKALCDHLHLIDKRICFTHPTDVENYLFTDLRIDVSKLTKFRLNQLMEIKKAYQDDRINQLISFIKDWKNNHA